MKDKVESLYRRLANQLIPTPLVHSKDLSTLCNCELYLKLENQQITGSFKLRGALSKFIALKDQQVDIKQVVAASTGNHAAAVCHAALNYDCKPTIFVPESISPYKLAKLRETSAQIQIAGKHSGESEQLASIWAAEHRLPLIHPYNDPEVIAGQGTIGLELWQQEASLDIVVVPIGGGGLISGIAAYLKEVNPEITIIGVQPENACEMADSVKKGHVVEPSEKTTISDGTAGGLDPETITLKYCQDFVDDFVLVSEIQILQSLQLINQYAGIEVEPAAALALAGILKETSRFKGKKVAAIVCGGNIQHEDFEKLLSMT